MTTTEPLTGMRAAVAWNRAHPIGTPVAYWPGSDRTYPAELTRTRSEAWADGDDVAIVNVMGAYRVPPALLEPLSAEILDAFAQGVTPDQIATTEWGGEPCFVEGATWSPAGVGVAR